jgi:drug/metabolite transporter (DMT)-like permease
MLFLVLSIICSVTVGVVFKILQQNQLKTTQILTINYATALLLSYVFFSPNFSALATSSAWPIYTVLGILLPTVFFILVLSIQYMGIVKTDAAQRLSLFIPILAAWFIFDEQFNSYKIFALLLGFPALVFLLIKPTSNQENKWIYPALVLLGFGLIDILFKQIALYTNLPFTTSLFVVFAIALVIMSLFTLYTLLFRKEKFNFKSIFWGVLVGIFNFSNIFFYLKAHQAFAQNPSTVFAGMNMGVIVIGSLVGIFIFKEKISKLNFVGLILALIAIVLIVLSQIGM